jgi:hypothetical protein
MKISTVCSAAFLLATSSASYSQSRYVSGQPSIDCTKPNNPVALILCREPNVAQAAWNFNSAFWALKFTVDDTQRPRLDRDQQAWRESLNQICALPRLQTPEDQAGRAMAEAFGRAVLGPGMRIPGPQPITQAHVNCLLNAYNARAALLRSKLMGDALAESQLSPGQHAQLQEALAEKGFFRPDQIGSGTHDGEFGPITRKAIKQFQQSLGASQSGFLSDDQRSALLERPRDREARVARMAAEAKDRQDKQDAEKNRLEAERDVAREWRRKIDEARRKGGQYAGESEFKWSLSEIDNPMIDD